MKRASAGCVALAAALGVLVALPGCTEELLSGPFDLLGPSAKEILEPPPYDNETPPPGFVAHHVEGDRRAHFCP